MHYFMSDIHGADEAYFDLKQRINLRKNDELYIIGDIFDGNNRNPKACLNILDDIIKNDNIHLILGNHELIHTYLYIGTNENDENTIKQCNGYLEEPICQGEYLRDYMYKKLTKRERDDYFDYLINNCELSEMVDIGKISFYLVHGAPALCTDIGMWQQDVSMTTLNLHYDYKREILSDPLLKTKNSQLKDKVMIIAGHTPTKNVYENNMNMLDETYPDKNMTKYQKVIKYNDKMLIDCGCRGNSIGRIRNGWASNLACVGIDAAGYFVEYLL